MLDNIEFAKQSISAKKEADNSITIGGQKLQYDDKVEGWIYNVPIIIKAKLEVNNNCDKCNKVTKNIINNDRTKIKCLNCQTIKEIKYE